MKSNSSEKGIITVDFIHTEPVVNGGLTIIEAGTVEHRIKLPSDTDYTVIEPHITGSRKITTTAECKVWFENREETQLDAEGSIESEIISGNLIAIAQKNANLPSWDKLRQDFYDG